MGILDQLLEKKDLVTYIDTRSQILRGEVDRNMKSLPPAARDGARLRLSGRLDELEHLLALIEQGRLKEEAKTNWRKLNPEMA